MITDNMVIIIIINGGNISTVRIITNFVSSFYVENQQRTNNEIKYPNSVIHFGVCKIKMQT